MRCGRSVGYAASAVCAMLAAVIVPDSSASTSTRRVLTPAVLSQACDQAPRSRPDPASNSARRSAKRVLPQAYFAK